MHGGERRWHERRGCCWVRCVREFGEQQVAVVVAVTVLVGGEGVRGCGRHGAAGVGVGGW